MIHNIDCLEFMKTIEDNSIDCIITDPPYLYLNHKLDRDFNQDIFFKECYRILKPNSYLCYFGRGVEMSKWDCICDEIGFKFKKEIVWDKGHSSNPLHPLARKHELMKVFAKGKPILNRVYINKSEYIELSGEHQIYKNDLNMLISKLKQLDTYEKFQEWIKGDFVGVQKTKHNISINKNWIKKDFDTAFKTYRSHDRGYLLSSILRVNREHYQLEHPTQKPIQLMKQLIELLTTSNDLVFDPFIGSGSTAVASIELDRKYLGCEIDKEYFTIATNRIDKAIKERKSRLF